MPNVRRPSLQEHDPDLEVEDDEELERHEPDDADYTLGTGAAVLKITKWLEQNILSGAAAIENQGAPIIQLVEQGDAFDKPVKRWRYHLSDAKTFAKIVVEVATERCERKFGKTKFEAIAPKLGTSVMFTLERPRSPNMVGRIGENEQGGTAYDHAVQQMDHNQALATLLVKRDDNLLNYLRRLLQDAEVRLAAAHKRNEELERGRLENAKLMENLISMKWLRDDAIEEKRKSAEWKGQFMKMAIPVAASVLAGPQAAGMIAGMLGQGSGGAPPAAAAPPSAGPVPQGPPPSPGSPSLRTIATHVDMFMGSIDEEQLQKLMMGDVLKQEQFIMLFQLKEAVEAWKREEGHAPAPSTQTSYRTAASQSAPKGPVVHEGVYEPPPPKTNGAPPKDEPWTGGFRMVNPT